MVSKGIKEEMTETLNLLALTRRVVGFDSPLVHS